MDSSDPLPHLLAKSPRAGRPAESIVSHLSATLRAAAALQERIGELLAADRVLGGRFWVAARLAAVTHDAGKVMAGFQQMLTSGQPWGHRHEVVSLGFLPALVVDEELRRWVASAVVTHHRPLTTQGSAWLADGRGGVDSIQRLYGRFGAEDLRTSLGPVRPEDVDGLAAWLAATTRAAGLPTGSPEERLDVVIYARAMLDDLAIHWQLPVDREHGLAAVLLQGAVTLADHLSSADSYLHIGQPIGAGFEKRLRGIRNHLYEHQIAAGQVDGHLLLRAPTGSGKTESGLLWAAAQVVAIAAATGGTPRVFFTLPYLASINAMVRRLAQILGDEDAVGVSHSRAASYHLATAIASDDEDGEADNRRVDAARKAVSRAAATRLFRETVRVGTPYQLLRGALAGAAHSGVLIDSANAVFVLDELHAYDAKRLGYILATTRLWEQLGGRIAVLSATLSGALVELIRKALRAPVRIVDAGNAGIQPRHRVRIRDRHLTDEISIAEMKTALAEDRAVLVVANNVAQAQELLDKLGPDARSHHGEEAATLLHSRFKRRDRATIEERIRQRYGTGEGRRPGLVVATQVVEVSLDVDFDVLFTAAAPLEALLQRFGRVNRLGQRPPADVVVHTPAYRTRRGESGEFADGVYPREPVEAGWHILCRNAGQVVDETDATRWLDEVYSSSWGQQWRQDVDHYLADFDRCFLTFDCPYDSREGFAERFDEMFEGTEAILAEDEENYRMALEQATRPDGRPDRSAGRLLGEEYLIPLPAWAGRLTRYERQLKVRIVDGKYDQWRGLLEVRGPDEASAAYRPGEVF